MNNLKNAIGSAWHLIKSRAFRRETQEILFLLA